MGGVLLGSGMTKKSLYPAEAEDVVLELAMPDKGLLDGSTPVFAGRRGPGAGLVAGRWGWPGTCLGSGHAG